MIKWNKPLRDTGLRFQVTKVLTNYVNNPSYQVVVEVVDTESNATHICRYTTGGTIDEATKLDGMTGQLENFREDYWSVLYRANSYHDYRLILDSVEHKTEELALAAWKRESEKWSSVEEKRRFIGVVHCWRGEDSEVRSDQ